MTRTFNHGTLTCYKYGCRCRLCRVVHSDYVREYRDRNELRDQPQGTSTGYWIPQDDAPFDVWLFSPEPTRCFMAESLESGERALLVYGDPKPRETPGSATEEES